MMFCPVGECGASVPGISAHITIAASTTNARMTSTSPLRKRDARGPVSSRVATALSISNARIEPAIDQVDREVERDKHARRDHHRSLHDGKVALVDRGDGEQTDARPAENGLG